MNKKDYEGYELIKAISDKEIKDKTKIEVHSLKVLDNTIAVIEYKNKRLEWGTGEFDTSYLFDKDYYFRILEDNTEEIEELLTIEDYECDKTDIRLNRDKINELVRIVNSIRKNIDKEYCCCCGVEITDENRALHNMCNECKYGIDWKEKNK